MLRWWEDPRLDDEGTYDYLVEELPRDVHEWTNDHYRSKCDECGKERKVYMRDVHYFYCWDGWDSMDYNTCWRCTLKSYTHNAPVKIKKKIKKEAMKIKPIKMIHHYRIIKKLDLNPKKYMSAKYMSKDMDHLWKIFEEEI